MVYELELDGQSIYCNSVGVVSVLLATGWTLKDSGDWARLVQEVAAGSVERFKGVNAVGVPPASC